MLLALDLKQMDYALEFSCLLQKRNRHMEEQDELNDIQIRLPTLHRSSRSSLNAVDNVNNKSNNTLAVTQAMVAPTPSTTPETESSKTTQSTSTAVSPTQVHPPTHTPNTNVVRISTL